MSAPVTVGPRRDPTFGAPASRVAARFGPVVQSAGARAGSAPAPIVPRGSRVAYARAPVEPQEEPVLRKLAAAVAALPVLAVVYLATIGRTGLIRIAAGVAAAAVVAVVAIASLPPTRTNALPASVPAPVEARLLDAVQTGQPLAKPLTLDFDSAMDPASVAAALRIEPDTAVTFSWDGSGRVLKIAPLGHWQPDTLYSLTVAGTARAADGATLAKPLRSLVLTSRAGSASIAPTRGTATGVVPTTAFRITLDRAVDPAAVQAALRIEPAVEGRVTAGASDLEVVFTPAAALAPNTTYRLTLDGLQDADGVPFESTPGLSVSTAGAPEVVRFRPRDGDKDIERTATLSVRFTEPMKRDVTAAAFHPTVGGKALDGKVAWAEQGTVLVFQPAAPLPYGATVQLQVDATATSKAGIPLAAAAEGAFKVVAKPATPAPKPAHKPATKPPTQHIPKPPSGGGGAVSGSWTGVEAYYLRLMNCTRTGGWVTSSGNCSSPGGRAVAPLKLNGKISARVSRPYAKYLATHNQCDHFIGGTPGDRLRRAGYTSYRWGENLGCRSGNPYSAVLGSHLYFQSERPYNGGHYRNLMDSRFHYVGIGVWVSSGRVRLVIDFYTP